MKKEDPRFTMLRYLVAALEVHLSLALKAVRELKTALGE